MSRLDELLQQYCPNGVEYKPLWSVTAWDKKFQGVEKEKQAKVIDYAVLLANDLFALQQDEGDVFLLSTGSETGWTTEELAGDNLREGEVVSIPWGKAGTVNVKTVIKYYKGKFVTGDNRIMTSLDTNVLNNRFLYHVIVGPNGIDNTFYRGSGIRHPDMRRVLDLVIPVPPLAVQEEIVKILDNYTEQVMDLKKELEAELLLRKQQSRYYLNHLVSSSDVYEIKPLRDVVKVLMCKRIKKDQTVSIPGIPFYKNGTLGKEADSYIPVELYEEFRSKYSFPRKGQVMLSTAGTVGRAVIYDGKPAYFQDSNVVWLDNDEKLITNEYLYWFCVSMPWQLPTRGTIKHLHNDMILDTMIAIPPLDVQSQSAAYLKAAIGKYEDLINGISAEITARQKQYEYYRDKLLSFGVTT